MCNTCCNSCNNGTHHTFPVYGQLRVNGSCVCLQLRSCNCWNGTGCSGCLNGLGTSGNANGGCGCNYGCNYGGSYGCNYGGNYGGNYGSNYGYFGCCSRRRATTIVGTSFDDGETNYYVDRCGSYSSYGTNTSRCGSCGSYGTYGTNTSRCGCGYNG